MDFFKKIFSKKGLGALALVLFAFLIPKITFAMSLFSIGDLAPAAIGQVMLIVSYAMGYIAAFFVAFATAIVEWLLNYNMQIISQPVVQAGFPIILSLTNLVLVLGLIVVAIATILRIESYGIKTILWKILVVAIAVNFGLVVVGTILNFSDNITLYMVNAINPSNSEDGFKDFATVITAAFNPQRGMTMTDEQIKGTESGVLSETFATTGKSFGAMLRPILGILLSFFTYAMILIILGAIVVVLVARYIALSLMIVVLPIVWAAWAFPAYKNKAMQWWEKFIKWAFAPIPIIFFLWLGLITAAQLGKMGTGGESVVTSGDGAGAAVSGFMGNLFTPLLSNFMNALLLAAIMGAGLMAAEKMGASFAGNATKGIKSLQGGMKNELIRRSKRGALRTGAAIREKSAPLTARLSTLGSRTIGAGGLKVKGALQRKSYAVKSETLNLDEDKKPLQTYVATSSDGKEGIWNDKVVKDSDGNFHTSYTQNASGQFIDKNGKAINGGSETGGWTTKDGGVFENEVSGRLAYTTKEGTILSDDDLKHERGGKVAVRSDGKVMENFMDEKGTLKAGYTDDKNRQLDEMSAGYAATQNKLNRIQNTTYGEAVEAAKSKAHKERKALWDEAQADSNILHALTTKQLFSAVQATTKPTQKPMKKADFLKLMEEKGFHFDHEEHGDDKDNKKDASHDNKGGGGGHAEATH